ncbi:hypothetical protein [Marinobacter salarius]|jgi:hypothetical protein|uniref:hypothetical protein n=1 Tax=Marinobacter salarius TaxID=1420917 RepID=UPI0018F194AD|nr:hypothetical protein [Marinobacter salarius]MBJ7278203.1 hypothetical protein [Marinobacter salarius]
MPAVMVVPRYYPDIVEIIRSADWLVHNFEGKDVDIYNAADYQHNLQSEGIKYQVILDMNCLQYLLNLTKRAKTNEVSRIAAAYLTFFRIADVQLNPTYAIYEKINYSGERANEAISSLEQFRGIDDHSLDELAAYALGFEQKLSIDPIVSPDRDDLRSKLLQYRRLTDWDSLYLCVLEITKVAIDTSISRPKKLLTFVNWCVSEFRFSLAALVYAAALFGRIPAKKMMKYKSAETRAKKLGSLRNMTWDLYYLDRYMKSWINKDPQVENLMLTADSGLKLSMELAVACQLAGDLEPLRPHLADEFQSIDQAYEGRHSADRAYNSKQWGAEYRGNLIEKYETSLLQAEI